MRGPPVVLTNTLGRPVTNVISERGAVPMTVVNTLGEPVTLVASGGEPVTLFNENGTLWDYPFSLFANNEQGAWYDPSDFSTLFQDSAGTTPVTAVEQPVRLMLDRSGRGNHATAPNDASRPVLRARYNQITFSEQFDNAVWTKVEATITANAAVAPDGTTTADKFIPSTSAAAHHITVSAASAAQERIGSVYVQLDGSAVDKVTLYPGGAATFAHFNLSNLTTTKEANVTSNAIEVLQNGWYRLTAVWPASVTSDKLRVYASSGSIGAAATAGDGTSGILIWGAQLLTAADQTATGGAYQRIAAATDYDTSNPVFRPYLAFDGSDDSLSTSSIDFSGTDEVTLFAGVHKASDAAAGIVAEFSATVASNNGSFYIIAPPSIGSTSIGFASKGTSQITVSATGIIAPSTSVISCITDISSDITTIRVNASQAGTSGGDLGTGNFGNHPLFIGRRNNTNLPFNGRLTSLIVLGRTATAAEISATEQWVNGKTGATL